MKRLHRWHQSLLKSERLLLLGLLMTMILVAVTQIVLRNLGSGGLTWADGFTRTSVLWLALLGAMQASRQQAHISIDVVAQRLPPRLQRIARQFSGLTTAGICFAAAWFSLKLVIQEYGYGDKAFAEIPNWLCQSILPLAFAIMGLRYGLSVFIATQQDVST